jgi:hypothetical protein
MSIIHLEQPSSTDAPGSKPKTVAATADAAKNLTTTLGTTLDDVNDSITVYPKCSYTNLSASALVKTGAGQLYGFFVNSYTATATVKFWDALTATTPVLINTMVIDRVGFYPMPGFTFGTGLYCTIATEAADITVAWR